MRNGHPYQPRAKALGAVRWPSTRRGGRVLTSSQTEGRESCRHSRIVTSSRLDAPAPKVVGTSTVYVTAWRTSRVTLRSLPLCRSSRSVGVITTVGGRRELEGHRNGGHRRGVRDGVHLLAAAVTGAEAEAGRDHDDARRRLPVTRLSARALVETPPVRAGSVVCLLPPP